MAAMVAGARVAVAVADERRAGSTTVDPGAAPTAAVTPRRDKHQAHAHHETAGGDRSATGRDSTRQRADVALAQRRLDQPAARLRLAQHLSQQPAQVEHLGRASSP